MMKITAQDLVPFIQESCELYGPEDNPIGIISCDHVLNRVRVKIKENNLSGYYVVFRGQKIRIAPNGRLEKWPPGFFDNIEKQLIKL